MKQLKLLKKKTSKKAIKKKSIVIRLLFFLFINKFTQESFDGIIKVHRP